MRNHIMYYKEQILKLCSENGILLPDEYYIPTPPEVDPFFMAKKDERFKKLNGACFYNGKLHNRKPELQEREQLTFF